jgi:glycosyltransferase involved in cell wall biosynthesis
MEQNRKWNVDYEKLRVVKQCTLTLRQKWKHPTGFQESGYLHLPLDTLLHLWKDRPEVVISGELGLRSVQVALYCLIAKCRLILWATVSEQTEKGRGRMREIIRRWLVDQADGVIVNGNSGARYIQKLGAAREKIVIIPYVSDREIASECEVRRNPHQPRTLIYLGQLTERKGILPFLKGLIRWKQKHPDQEIRFVLIGEGPLRPEIEQQASACPIEIDTLGFVEYDSIPAYLQQGDILVLPSLADEWGLVVNEAMAMCLPVLGSEYSQAVDELVVEGKSGWRFFPDSEVSLESAINRALGTPLDELQRMGENARKSAQHLTADFAAERMIAILESFKLEAERDC